MIEMCPCGNLGHDPTKRRMLGELRPKLIGEYPWTIRRCGDDCCGSLVATRFNAENYHRTERAILATTTFDRYAAAVDQPGGAIS